MRWCLGLIGNTTVILLILGNEVSNLIQIKRLNLLGLFLEKPMCKGLLPTDAVFFVDLQASFDEILRLLRNLS